MIKRNSDGSIGFRIYEARKAKGLTLQEVADLLGVSKATVSRYETDVIKDFQFEKVPDICKLLGISPNTLFGWGSEKISDAEKEAPLKKSDFQCQLTLSYAPKEEVGVGKKLKSLREHTGLSLDKVQQLTGIDNSTLNRYENEVTSKIPLDVFTVLCRFYDVTPNEILEFDERPNVAIGKQIESLKEAGSTLFKIAYEIMKQTDELKEKLQAEG